MVIYFSGTDDNFWEDTLCPMVTGNVSITSEPNIADIHVCIISPTNTEFETSTLTSLFNAVNTMRTTRAKVALCVLLQNKQNRFTYKELSVLDVAKDAIKNSGGIVFSSADYDPHRFESPNNAALQHLAAFLNRSTSQSAVLSNGNEMMCSNCRTEFDFLPNGAAARFCPGCGTELIYGQ